MAATTPGSEIDVRSDQQADAPAVGELGRVGAPRQVGVLGHLARSTRESARAQGMVFAAHELFRMDSLLWAFRAHLLDTPSELRGVSDNAVLGMLEMLIAREAMSRPVRDPQRELLAGCRVRPDVAGARRHGSCAVRLRGWPPRTTTAGERGELAWVARTRVARPAACEPADFAGPVLRSPTSI